MQKITYVSLLFITFSGFTQELSFLKGKIAVDTLQLEAINIVNITQEIGTVNNALGYFSIKANPGDTIVFSSVQFTLKEYIVKKNDLVSDLFLIKLNPSVNQLDEVYISQYSLSGDIKKDISEIPTYEENFPLWNATELKKMGVNRPNDAQSPVENTALGGGSNLAKVSIDLGFLVNLISGAFRNKKTDEARAEYVTDFYKEDFFVNQLNIPETEFYNFLDYLDEETGIKIMLKTRDRLKILEFLIHHCMRFREKYGLNE